jgi:predicted acyltransferase
MTTSTSNSNSTRNCDSTSAAVITSSSSSTLTSTSSKRLISLDAFRGASIAAMILVNNPGTWSAVYPQLMHAEWNGWTFTDMVFPFFLFIVGVAMVLSFSQRMEGGCHGRQLMLQVVRRTAILFCLGLLLSAFPTFDLSTLRIPGVLQRIALCYFFTSLILLRTDVKGQVLWLVVVLASYWLLMEFYPVPGIGAGVYEPGRNFSAYVDSLSLHGHMWSKYRTWDPEGIISTIPAVGTTLFGVLAGQWLRVSRRGEAKTAGMLAFGLVLVMFGRFLDIWLPINKSIWTSSFSILMAGWAFICFSIYYWLIDVRGYRRWAMPFVIFGKNAIAAYVLSGVLDTALRFIRVEQYGGTNVSLRTYLFDGVFSRLASPMNASLLFAIGFVLMMFVVVWIMWKKSWFLKI